MQNIRNIECAVYEKNKETYNFCSFLEVNPLNLGINIFCEKKKNVTLFVLLLYKSVHKLERLRTERQR